MSNMTGLPTPSFDSLGADSLIEILCLLSLSEVSRCLRVSTTVLRSADASEHLWSDLCDRAWEGKVYIPASLRVMARGEVGVSTAVESARAELQSLKVSQLKEKMQTLRVRVGAGECVEKKDYVEAILTTQRQRASTGDRVDKLLGPLPAATLLRRERESLPKAALRLSLQDAKRTKAKLSARA